MKIICTKEEFKHLAEACYCSRNTLRYHDCSGCVLNDFCSNGGDITEDTDKMSEVTDIVEIESGD